MSQPNREKPLVNRITQQWRNPQVVALLFLGFSAGIPILLIFSTLSVWLREAGVERSAITFFSWAALGYSFKFIWAPLVDLLPLPFLTKILGRRRGWLILAQILIILSICCMAMVDPRAGEWNLTIMAMAAVLLGFSSATQDIVIDAFRIECAEESLQALLASTYIIGYRIAMIVAGAGSLFLADFFANSTAVYNYHAWKMTYLAMAAVMGVGLLTTFFVSEPKSLAGGENSTEIYAYSANQYFRLVILFCICAGMFALMFFLSADLLSNTKNYLQTNLMVFGKIGSFGLEVLRFLTALSGAALVAYVAVKLDFADREMVRRSYVEPVRDFFHRYGMQTALLLLLLVGFYRVSDIVLGVISNVFYVDMGFSKSVIGGVTKTFGLLMVLCGGLVGGVLTVRFGVNNILMVGAILSAVTNLMFMVLTQFPGDVVVLSIVVAVDNLAAGVATTAFVAFLSSLTNISFTAVQYAIFSSLMTLFPKLFGGYSGTIVESSGYGNFFILTTVMGIPVILLILAVRKRV